MRQPILLLYTALFALSACNKAEPEKTGDPTGTEDTVMVPEEGASNEIHTGAADIPDRSAWAGKWTGVEGTYATITSKGDGKFSIDMKYGLDDDMKGVFDGTATADGIRFKRGDSMVTLKKATGEETGMKWLAGKKDCLVVEAGAEGYCRD